MAARLQQGVQLLQHDRVVAGQMLEHMVVHHHVEARPARTACRCLCRGRSAATSKSKLVARVVEIVGHDSRRRRCACRPPRQRGLRGEVQHPRAGADPADFGQQQPRERGSARARRSPCSARDPRPRTATNVRAAADRASLRGLLGGPCGALWSEVVGQQGVFLAAARSHEVQAEILAHGVASSIRCSAIERMMFSVRWPLRCSRNDRFWAWLTT